MNDAGRPVLYAIATGSPAARDVGMLVDLAQADGWDVCVVTSPDGRRFIDAGALSAKTGHPVRSEYKDPDAPDVLPPADAMIVAPITCNSLAKWAAGISDTLPLGLLVEAVGKRQPVVAVPFSNRAQLSFPAVQDAIRKLASWGVTMLVGDEVYEQHEPGTGEDFIHLFPWHRAWQALGRVVAGVEKVPLRGTMGSVVSSRLGKVFAAHDVAVAYLFGSRAEGTATETSDHDVAVLFATGEPTFTATVRLGADLAAELDTAVDVVDLDRATLELRGRVAEQGRLLYSRDEPRRVRFEVDARVRWIEFRPVVRAATSSYLRRVATSGLR